MPDELGHYTEAELEAMRNVTRNLANLWKRKLYLHLTSAFLFGLLPAGVIYAMDDKLGLFQDGGRLVPCGSKVDMNTWLLTSAYASATYVGVTCFLQLCWHVLCVNFSPSLCMTCMHLINQTFLLGLVLWFANGAVAFNTQVARDR